MFFEHILVSHRFNPTHRIIENQIRIPTNDKVWELHNRAEKNDKVLEILEDVKSLLRVHLMNDGSQSSSVEEVSDKPKSIIGKLFKK